VESREGQLKFHEEIWLSGCGCDNGYDGLVAGLCIGEVVGVLMNGPGNHKKKSVGWYLCIGKVVGVLMYGPGNCHRVLYSGREHRDRAF
jgi:hypothetical protein